MRYFLTLSYLGTRYSGWQAQPNASSVQATLEAALSTILRQPVELTGCGRTDAGVHARGYVAHFDAPEKLPPTFLNGLNSLLPDDIAVWDLRPVHPEAHARYDAFERSYEYHISLRKDPFHSKTAWFYPQHQLLDLEKMQHLAGIFLRYNAFYPFCKTHSSATHYNCELKQARWELRPSDHRLVFLVTANRFLRGMVRLMTGACIRVGAGKLPATAIEQALENQTSLKKSLSVPPQGLCLTSVKYPY